MTRSLSHARSPAAGARSLVDAPGALPPGQAPPQPGKRSLTEGIAPGAGRPLPAPVRAQMEGAFGVELSQVRVHEGGQAAALGARAYTQGADLYFSPGSYDPDSRAGQELLGHELTHVVQQGAGRVAAPQGKGAPINADPALEAEADELGARAARGEPAPVPGARGTPPAGGPIQGVFLDQELEPPHPGGALRERDPEAKSRAVAGAVDHISSIFHPNRAKTAKELVRLVRAYEAADGALDPVQARQALLKLEARAGQIAGKTGSDRLRQVAAQLAQEAHQIAEDLGSAEAALVRLAEIEQRLDAEGKGNADELGGLRNEADARRVKYGTGRAQFGTCAVMQLSSVQAKADALLDRWATLKSATHGQDKQQTQRYGSAHRGKIPEEIQRYLAEFQRIHAFLGDRGQVVANLRPIAEPLQHVADDAKLGALKQALAAVEQSGDFPEAVFIPMGILPAEVFLRFNALAVMDDYGAGVVHGELSHRLQWAAIIRYIQANAGLFTHTPWQLYQQMSSPPFAGGRIASDSSMWGSTVDANTLQHEGNYRSPATLQRDLLDAVPAEHAAHHGRSAPFPLPARPDGHALPPDLPALAPIGIALSLLREERVLQELAATAADALPQDSLDAQANGGMGVPQWSGVPSEATSARTAGGMLDAGSHEIVDRGSTSERSAFDPIDEEPAPRPWMILRERPSDG